MILIHAYRPAYVDKLIKTGIAQKGDGFKINQTFRMPEDKKFNAIAKEEGSFFNLVSSTTTACPSLWRKARPSIPQPL